ncbi:SUMF1/EgtB/PvdO family nonheme iron enzyme [Halomonas sp. B23F22_10]|uniref:SUMF1/EgtB/PvdO family nonheme iron enzyme n=1 Tax=Halomonas sp. B23F22_10 TaxID=3459515 RepID=UPI00373EFAE1
MQLAGTLCNAAGPLAGVTIIFEATATTMNGVLVSSDAQFTTQEDGTYLIDLKAGHYYVYWIERGHRVRLGTVTADQFSEASLPEVLQASPVPVDSSAIEDEIQEALAQMQADLAASTDLRDETAGLRDAAQQAATDAEAARDAAQASEQVSTDNADATAADRSDVTTKASQVSSDAAAASSAKTAAEAARDDAVNIAGGDSQPIFDAWVVDVERRQVENDTGGACTIERTAGGEPCYMFVIPKLKWEDLVPSGELGTGVHEAFLVDGVEKSELLVGMFQAATVNGELVSQARQVPRRSISWDNARSEAQSAGFDIMSNWEWSAIAFWCMANGFQPRGNTDYGQSHSHPHEQGSNVEYDNIATGSGPNTWNHNNAANGIADLVGNVWEWQWGFKMVDGRIFLAPDNDKSLVESSWVDTGWDMPSTSSTNWAGLYDAQNEAPEAVRRALIMPNGIADPDGSIWTNLDGERFPYRGGHRGNAGYAGLGALFLSSGRGYEYNSRGLRLSRLV